MRVVLTGASGLIGRALASQLSRSCEIIAIGRRPPPAGLKIEHVELDLLSPGVAGRLPQRADALIHLAQCDGYADFPETAGEILGVNVAGLAQLLQWAKTAGVKSFVHTSTGGVYGRGPRPFKEIDPIRIDGPLQFYLRTKQMAEILAEGFRDYFTVVALRPFFVYGAGQRASALVPRLIGNIRGGTPVTLAGDDGMRLNPVHVGDVVRCVEASLQLTESDTINLAGPEILSLRAMAAAIGEAVGRAPVFQRVEEGVGGGDVLGDTARMTARLLAPETGFAQGVSDLLRASAA